MTCPGRQLGMTGSAARKEHPEDMAAQRAAGRFVMVMPAGKAAHIEARVAFGLGKPSVLWPRPRRDARSSIGCLPVRMRPRHGLPRRS
jgi:hypothetical protein